VTFFGTTVAGGVVAVTGAATCAEPRPTFVWLFRSRDLFCGKEGFIGAIEAATDDTVALDPREAPFDGKGFEFLAMTTTAAVRGGGVEEIEASFLLNIVDHSSLFPEDNYNAVLFVLANFSIKKV